MKRTLINGSELKFKKKQNALNSLLIFYILKKRGGCSSFHLFFWYCRVLEHCMGISTGCCFLGFSFHWHLILNQRNKWKQFNLCSSSFIMESSSQQVVVLAPSDKPIWHMRRLQMFFSSINWLHVSNPHCIIILCRVPH